MSTPARVKRNTGTPPQLPWDCEAEKAVLGAILVHNDALDTAADLLRAEDFHREAHRRIYTALTRLREGSIAIDFVTLKDELARAGWLEDVGGPVYIASLADGVPRGLNVKYYGGIVREKARLRALIAAGNRLISEAYEASEPTEAILARADLALLDLHAGRNGHLTPLREGIPALVQRMDYRHAHKGELLGVDTGFASLNDLTLGWRAGTLNILAARPSIGKSTCALNMAVAAARTHGTKTAMFSLEMRREELEQRILANLAGVAATRIDLGALSPTDFTALDAAIEIMHTLPLWIDDRAGRTLPDIRRSCRRLQREHGLDQVVIDYVQLMPGTLDRRGATRNEELTHTSSGIKELAGELSVPIHLLSQLSRAGSKRYDPRPRLEDLRDTGALEQDGDVVTLLHRKNYREGGKTEAIIAKQRNGPTGSVYLSFERDTLTFTDAPEQEPDPEPSRSTIERSGRERRLPDSD
jgi:replicative DNA helicase